MDSQDEYLVDDFIRYSRNTKKSFNEAAIYLAELAKQREPELRIKESTEKNRLRILREANASRKEFFVARFMVRTLVRYARWTYFPKFNVISEPAFYSWRRIKVDRPTGKLAPNDKTFYLDNLYHDNEFGMFWMPEPYLSDVPESAVLFEELKREDLEELESTRLRKIDPSVVMSFKAKRSLLPEFKVKKLESFDGYHRRPFGCKGWKERVKIVPRSLKMIRVI